LDVSISRTFDLVERANSVGFMSLLCLTSVALDSVFR
jgi:hypothetical protein